jgi:hypothetical protein
MKRRKYCIAFCALITILFFSSKGFSTPKPPGGGGAPACWPPPCSVPVDGGISLLLAAGASLGAFKLLKNKEK